MKIGINGYCLKKKSGIGVYARLLLKEMLSVDKKNQYVLFTPKKLKHGLKAKNMKEIYYPAESAWKMLYWENFVLPDLIKKEGIDVFFNPNFSLPFKELGCKKVITVHDIAFKLFPQYVDWKGKIFYALNAARSIKQADKIIVDSVSTKMDLVKHFNTKQRQVKIIYLAADKKYRPIKDQKALQAVRQKYCLKKPFLFYYGMIGTRKNLPMLIKAFKQIGQKFDCLDLVLAGQAVNGFNEVKKEISRQNLENRVKIINFVKEEDLPLLLNNAEMLVMPSLYEGFGLPVLEAMQSGTPVACTKNSSLPEIGGDAVAYIRADNLANMSRIITEILSDRRKSDLLVKKGLRRAKKFSAKRMALETLKILKWEAGK